jgi:hypothetical protein
MPSSFRVRAVPVNQVVYDQIDLFLVDQYTRAAGVQTTDVTLALFLNNSVVTWPLVNGAAVLDSQVVSGSVYWAALQNGSYGIRFLPNQLGHWSLTVTYPGSSQIVGISYDVSTAPDAPSGFSVGFCT